MRDTSEVAERRPQRNLEQFYGPATGSASWMSGRSPLGASARSLDRNVVREMPSKSLARTWFPLT